jgi:hypothetical protein
MFVLAHILGIPVEETLLPWAASSLGTGTFVLFAAFAHAKFRKV